MSIEDSNSFIGKDELQSLLSSPDDLLKEINKRFISKKEEIDSEYESNKLVYDTKMNLLESEMEKLKREKKEIEETMVAIGKVHEKEMKESREAVYKAKEELRAERQKNARSKESFQNKEHEIRDISNSLSNVNSILEKRDERIKQLTSSTSFQEQKISLLEEKCRLTEEKVYVEQKKIFPLEQKIRYLESSLKTARETNEWLESEIKRKGEDVIGMRKKIEKMSAEKETKNNQMKNDLILLKEENDRMKTRIKESEEEMKNLHVVLRDQKLSNLNSTLEFEKIKKDADNTKETLSKCLNEEKKKNSRISKSLENQNKKFEKLVSKKEEKIMDLKEIIEEQKREIKTLHNQIDSKDGDAVKLKKGIAMTDIYKKYIETQEKLGEKEKELLSKNEYIKRIKNEIEKRLPVLERQREEYEETMAAHIFLTKKFTKIQSELKEIREKSASTFDENRSLKEKYESVRRENDDLSEQIKTLLKSKVDMEDNARKESVESSGPISSRDVISERLVTFKNIDELTKRNRELLSVVRRLSDDLEKKDLHMQDIIKNEIEEKLSDMNTEIKDMRIKFKENQITIQKLKEEKELLLKLNSELVVNKNNTDDYEEGGGSMLVMIDEIQKEFSKERAILKEELSNERNLRLKNEKTFIKTQAELSFLKEREKNNIEKIKELKKQCELDLVTRKELEKRLSVTENNLSKSKEVVYLAKQKTKIMESRLERIKGEIKSMKDSNEVLKNHLQSINEDKRAQSKIFQKFRENSTKIEVGLKKEKENLEVQVNELSFEINQKKEELKAKEIKFDILEGKVNKIQTNLKKEIDKFKSEKIKLKEEIISLKQEIVSHKNIIKKKEDEMEKMRGLLLPKFGENILNNLRSGNLGTSDSNKSVVELKKELSELNVDLIKEIEKRKFCENMLEECRKEKEEVVMSLEKYQNQIDMIKKQMEKVSEKNNVLEEKIKKHSIEYNNLKEENERLKIEKNVVLGNEEKTKTKEEMLKQKEITNLIQRKYESEVVTLSEKIKECDKMRNELESLKSKYDETRGENEVLKREKNEHDNRIVKIEEKFLREKEELKDFVKELKEQKKLLLENIEITKRATGEVEGDKGENTEKVENLEGLVEYLKREKELDEGNILLLEQKVEKYMQLFDHSKRTILELRTEVENLKKLDEMRKNEFVREEEYNEKTEMMNQVKLYKENNLYLRNQHEVLKEKIVKMEKKNDDLSQEFEVMKRVIVEKNTEIGVLKGEKESLLKTCNQLKERVASLLQKNDPNNEQENLRNENRLLVAAKESLLEDKNLLESEINKKGGEIKDLKEKYKKMSDIFKRMKETLSKKNEEIKTHKKTIRKNEETVSKFQQKLLNSSVEKEQLSAELEEKNGKVKLLESQIAKNNAVHEEKVNVMKDRNDILESQIEKGDKTENLKSITEKFDPKTGVRIVEKRKRDEISGGDATGEQKEAEVKKKKKVDEKIVSGKIPEIDENVMDTTIDEEEINFEETGGGSGSDDESEFESGDPAEMDAISSEETKDYEEKGKDVAMEDKVINEEDIEEAFHDDEEEQLQQFQIELEENENEKENEQKKSKKKAKSESNKDTDMEEEEKEIEQVVEKKEKKEEKKEEKNEIIPPEDGEALTKFLMEKMIKENLLEENEEKKDSANKVTPTDVQTSTPEIPKNLDDFEMSSKKQKRTRKKLKRHFPKRGKKGAKRKRKGKGK